MDPILQLQLWESLRAAGREDVLDKQLHAQMLAASGREGIMPWFFATKMRKHQGILDREYDAYQGALGQQEADYQQSLVDFRAAEEKAMDDYLAEHQMRLDTWNSVQDPYAGYASVKARKSYDWMPYTTPAKQYLAFDSWMSQHNWPSISTVKYNPMPPGVVWLGDLPATAQPGYTIWKNPGAFTYYEYPTLPTEPVPGTAPERDAPLPEPESLTSAKAGTQKVATMAQLFGGYRS